MIKSYKDPNVKLDELWRAIMQAAASEDIVKVFRCAYAIKAIKKQIDDNDMPVIQA